MAGAQKGTESLTIHMVREGERTTLRRTLEHAHSTDEHERIALRSLLADQEVDRVFPVRLVRILPAASLLALLRSGERFRSSPGIGVGG